MPCTPLNDHSDPATSSADRPRRQRAACRHGLSSVEVVVSALLVGLLLVASMNSVGGIFRTWRVTHRHHDADTLANQLLTEILPQHYEEPDDVPQFGREGAEDASDRSTWDDVDDYHGWSSPPQHRDSTPLAGYDAWNRSVAVALIDPADPTQVVGSDRGLKRVTVTVTDPRGRQTVRVAYRSRWGMLQQVLAGSTSVQSWISSEMQTDGSVMVYGGAPLMNHVD